MGIPSYFSYILRNHKYILGDLKKTKCEHLYLDANSIIYEHLDKDNIYQCVLESILDIFKKIDSNKKYVCFDGVAPVAKLKQQKQRRYKSWLTKQILNKKHYFNSNCITPGTTFMKNLNEYLEKHLPKDVILNGPNECGEGEYKIFNYIRDSNEKSHMVYGLDADLIMLGLLQYDKQIYLYRETKHFSYLPFVNIENEYALNLYELGKQIDQILGHKNMKLSIDNYCFLCFFCGNDFLPHIPSIQIRNHGIDHLIEHYKYLNGKTLILNGKIIWSHLSHFFMDLSKHEIEMIKTQILWKKKKRINQITHEDRLNHLPLMDREYEDYLYDHPEQYNKVLFKQQNDEPICNNYLEMLEWTWNYYNGREIDYTLYYNMNYAPLFSSLLKHIPCFEESFLKETKINYVHPITQLIYVLPFEDYHLIDSIHIEELCKEFPLLKKMNHEIDYHFCIFFWECHVNFPYLNIKELNKYVLNKLSLII
jgi:5'-3' exonuclease